LTILRLAEVNTSQAARFWKAPGRSEQTFGRLLFEAASTTHKRKCVASRATATRRQRPSGSRSLPTWQPDYHQPGVHEIRSDSRLRVARSLDVSLALLAGVVEHVPAS
jgi:hypothetical protein